LAVGGDGLAALVHEISEGARDGEVAVDAVEFDVRPRRLDPRLLLRVVRLVVVRERHGVAAAREDRARIARVGADDRRRRDEALDRGRAALVLPRRHVLQVLQLVVERHQRRLERRLRLAVEAGEVGLEVARVERVGQVLWEVARRVVRDHVAAVPVKDAE